MWLSNKWVDYKFNTTKILGISVYGCFDERFAKF